MFRKVVLIATVALLCGNGSVFASTYWWHGGMSDDLNDPNMQTLFDQAVDTIFLTEFCGDDSGYIQALDANGDPIDCMVLFGPFFVTVKSGLG